MLVTRKEDDAGWLEEGAADEALARFNLPVRHLVVDELTTRAASTVSPDARTQGERRLCKPEVTGSIPVRSIGRRWKSA